MRDEEAEALSRYHWQLRLAVTWRLITELMRRYHASHALRVLETHPGGGQYHCLSIYDSGEGPWRHLANFNVGSGRLHGWVEGGGPAPEPLSYFVDYLEARDPLSTLRKAAAVAGLPPWGDSVLPPTSPTVLVFRLLALFAESDPFGRYQIRLSPGWIDDQWTAEPAPELKEIVEEPGLFDGDWAWEAQMKVASRYWLLSHVPRQGERALIGVLDLRGAAIHPAGRRLELWPLWKRSKGDLWACYGAVRRHLGMGS